MKSSKTDFTDELIGDLEHQNSSYVNGQEKDQSVITEAVSGERDITKHVLSTSNSVSDTNFKQELFSLGHKPHRSIPYWTGTRIKFICTYVNRGVAPVYTDDVTGVVAISQKCISGNGSLDLIKGRLIRLEVTNYVDSLLKVGDIVVNSTGTGTLGRVGIASDEISSHNFSFVADGHVTIMRVDEAKVLSDYIIYLLLTDTFLEVANECLAFGSTNQIELGRNSIRTLGINLPNLTIQHEIATFLDKETSRIDELIGELEHQNSLLRERRQAVITEAVSGKSQHPNQKPETPRQIRLKFVANINPSKIEISKLNEQTEVSFVPMENIGTNGIVDLRISLPIYEVRNGYTYFKDDDVAIAKITPCFENGKGAVMSQLTNGVGFGTTELIIVRPEPNRTISQFLYWIFASHKFRDFGSAVMYGAAGQKRVPEAFVLNYVEYVPDIRIQHEIATFLDKETSRIDELISEIDNEITLLKERRQALITAAVTGQIDVSESVA